MCVYTAWVNICSIYLYTCSTISYLYIIKCITKYKITILWFISKYMSHIFQYRKRQFLMYYSYIVIFTHILFCIISNILLCHLILIIHILGNIFLCVRVFTSVCLAVFGIWHSGSTSTTGYCRCMYHLQQSSLRYFFIVELMNQNQIIRGVCNVVFTLDGSPSTHFWVTVSLMFLSFTFWWSHACWWSRLMCSFSWKWLGSFSLFQWIL